MVERAFFFFCPSLFEGWRLLLPKARGLQSLKNKSHRTSLFRVFMFLVQLFWDIWHPSLYDVPFWLFLVTGLSFPCACTEAKLESTMPWLKFSSFRNCHAQVGAFNFEPETLHSKDDARFCHSRSWIEIGSSRGSYFCVKGFRGEISRCLHRNYLCLKNFVS